MTNLDCLLSPYPLNKTLTLKNRMVMAPMTRNMANEELSPTEKMAEYYSRRAESGLIVTEGTIIAPSGRGYSNTPGIYTQSQINGWRRVTDKVHAQGGTIFLQIWHVGRVSHPVYLNGALPISASETVMTGKIRRAEGLFYGKSRAATLMEIQELIDQYAQAAKNAIDAGFDGVEIHGANGYLVDQFLHYHTNHRSDHFGQTPENMARFAIEVVKSCIKQVGADRVGIRLSPGSYLNEIVGDPRDALVFQYLLAQLNALKIAYVHTGNFNDDVQFNELGNRTMTEFLRYYYTGTVIASGGYTVEKANQDILNKKYDLIAIGRPFIANYDLVSRVRNGSALIPYEVNMLETLF
ncbi:alkene reductase [Legionella waltersii]|uniref:NADH-dependent flavin oxidoreductase, Oye family n=1 Tax=Legionella waltersii TaxID=66969 RepID=A0A0W1ADA6_9GAMM|nr:alkene reductase [Legionella waltersii]KTD79326.1 NADH-dependent flavin oxidoreductase, Oye family [Legionella waltersii]SNV13071.1 NADH-dependent flavin oxidoreductase, Oye family [Legionella waltersii]